MRAGARLDLHVHSTSSPDGRASVAQYAGRAAELGLAGFALTDHNTVRGWADLASVRARYPSLLLVPGIEISTAVGHLLAYGLAESPPVRRPLPETVEWIVSHGGEPVLAHPFRWPHGAGRHLGETRGLRAVETLNGHNGAGVNRRAAALAGRLGVASTGASDAHQVLELGRCVTVFQEGCARVDDVLEALRRGKVQPEGRSLTPPGWFAWAVRAGAARLARGFREI